MRNLLQLNAPRNHHGGAARLLDAVQREGVSTGSFPLSVKNLVDARTREVKRNCQLGDALTVRVALTDQLIALGFGVGTVVVAGCRRKRVTEPTNNLLRADFKAVYSVTAKVYCFLSSAQKSDDDIVPGRGERGLHRYREGRNG
jgi:hypothetical protein